MTPIFLDFETYWSVTHSLSKMSPTEYVMHPETEIQSMAIKVGTGITECVFGEADIRAKLATVDWSDAIAIGHNMSGFDSMILAWRLGVRPKLWGCTAAMARSKYAKVCGVSLDKLSKHLNIGHKLDLEATNTKGRKLADFTEDERNALAVYNIMDVELCAALFKTLTKGFPKAELHQIDMTTRMLVEPKFVLDKQAVQAALTAVQQEKTKSLLALAGMLDIEGVPEGPSIVEGIEEEVRAQLASTAKFARLLNNLGVKTPMKKSLVTGDDIPALAKSDAEFIALQDHDNPVVAAAARARLQVKSTILETRLQAFLRAADAVGGRIPVPLKYAGADTTGRWSGEQYNMQNLPRINPKVPKASDALRNSLLAPKGHLVVVADLSGIELRVNHFLWQVAASMDMYKADPEADLYRAFAAARYKCAPDEVTKDQRQLAKVAQLGLGFGAGPTTFQKVAKMMGGLDLSADEAAAIVEAWRSEYTDIVVGWKRFQKSLPSIFDGVEKAIDPWGLCVTEKHAVRLPSGRRIHYPDLRFNSQGPNGEWWYGTGRPVARIYAGKGVENLVQALARDVIAEHALRGRKELGLIPTLMVHDELAYVVPEARAQETLDGVQAIMQSGVSWWPELITWSAGDIAPCYGAAK